RRTFAELSGAAAVRHAAAGAQRRLDRTDDAGRRQSHERRSDRDRRIHRIARAVDTMRSRLLLAALVVVALGVSADAQWRPGGHQRIILLVDSSSSVAPMLTSFRAGLKEFLDALPGDPEIAIISTGGQFRN